MHLIEAAVWLIDAVPRAVNRVVGVGICLEILRKHDLIGVCAPYREGIAHNAPLWLTPQAQHFAKVVDEAGQNKPARMPIPANGLGGLQQVFDLGEVRVRIAVVDERIKEFSSLPNGLRALVETEVLLLLRHHIVERLVLVVEPVELGDFRRGLLVILPEFLLALPFLITASQKIVPLIHVLQRCGYGNYVGGHSASPRQRFTLPLTYCEYTSPKPWLASLPSCFFVSTQTAGAIADPIVDARFTRMDGSRMLLGSWSGSAASSNASCPATRPSSWVPWSIELSGTRR